MRIAKTVGAIVFAGLILMFSWWWFGTQMAAPSKQTTESVLETEDEHMTKGDPNAPVRMVQYVDMMCPDCARAHEETMPLIEKNYVDTGKLHYEIRVVAKIHHEDADVAAEGAYCAAEQGKFWQFLDLGYEKLRSLPDTAKGIEDSKIFSGNNARTFAETIGVNVPTWEHCVKQETYKDVIDQHEKAMSSLNAYGTPHSVINGENYNGAPPYSAFKTVIDAELKKKQEKT